MAPEHNGHRGAGGETQPIARPATHIPNDPAAAWVEERTRVAVGRNVNVSGRLVFHEPVRIEGRFRGEVSSAELVVISEGATIEGKVRAPRLLIMGELRGDIAASKRVVLGPHSRMDGNIETESLTICEGAHFDGHVRMTAAGRKD
ncbi:MAG TPA: polymer-forming cytoskeletal protein [Candidatus Binataceae bacterium]|nr:polymer-forming cytoskeletal protein [Candidatus Binataceae bacterium]